MRYGYAATTITAIADTADVAVQTVYAIFGTKRAVLTELLQRRTVADDEKTPLRDREDWRAMEREPDPYRQVALLAAIATRIGSRMGALHEVMAGAGGSDPEIADFFEHQQQHRYKDQRRVARSLSRAGALRPGLCEAHATDIMWTVANPRTYRTLVTERRWPVDDYEHWLTRMLTGSLLVEPPA